MAYKAVAAKCPKTGKELQFGQDMPLDDPRYSTVIAYKGAIDFSLTLSRCPECGESHTFSEEHLREIKVVA